MNIESKYFSVPRESIGFEPIVKMPDYTNSGHKIKNCSLRIRECQKYLGITEEQVKNAVKINLLVALTINNILYICIDSANKIKNNMELMERIFDEDRLSVSAVSKILSVSVKNVKRLIDEGYLKFDDSYIKKSDTDNYIKRGEIRRLKLHIDEVKDFWKSKAKINRQIGAKKSSDKRKIKDDKDNSFKDVLFNQLENIPHMQSKLIKSCFALLALNYYIDRKLDKNIFDNELLNLRAKSVKKLLMLYQSSNNLRIYFIQGDKYIKYCPECRELINKEYNVPYSDSDKKDCINCKEDNDFYSMIFFLVSLSEYLFVLSIPYKEIKVSLNIESITHQKASFSDLEDDKGIINKIFIGKNDLKTFKLFDVITYLKEFIKSKDIGLSLNL